MKKLFLIPLLFLFIGCIDQQFNNLKPPVIIIAKGYRDGIVVKDGNGELHTYANCGLSIMLNSSKNIGDTIK